MTSADHPTFRLSNRKYLGAKTALLPWLFAEFERRAGKLGHFCDPMVGTGVVAHEAALRADRLTCGDFLLSNVVPLRAFLGPKPPGIEAAIRHLNHLPPMRGYVYVSFGNRYFSLENAARIDAVREEIERLPRELRDSCLASLLFAVDKVANTIGQFDSFLKNIDSEPIVNGRHVVDANAQKSLLLKVPDYQPTCPSTVICADALDVVATTECDTLYIDPPYNGRQYADLYHVLENIARWEKPSLSGVTCKFDRSKLRSSFSKKLKAGTALRELACAARCRHFFLSYGSEGLLSHEEILECLGQGTEMSEREYPVFGRGAGRAKQRQVLERLYYVRK